MKFIKKYKSPNFDNRKEGVTIKYIIIHYTAMQSDIEAIKHLCDNKKKVSSHFLISKQGAIYYLVNLKNRAWHVGISYWKKQHDINSYSIGIEMDYFPQYNKKFTKLQIAYLVKLLIFLKKKYKIEGKNILGHSDVSPYRKIDPGINFPWHTLFKLKICKKPKVASTSQLLNIEFQFRKKLLVLKKQKILYMLYEIGYDISKAKKNRLNFILLIQSFQFHFRPSLADGKIDKDTYNILIRYFNESLTN